MAPHPSGLVTVSISNARQRAVRHGVIPEAKNRAPRRRACLPAVEINGRSRRTGGRAEGRCIVAASCCLPAAARYHHAHRSERYANLLVAGAFLLSVAEDGKMTMRMIYLPAYDQIVWIGF